MNKRQVPPVEVPPPPEGSWANAPVLADGGASDDGINADGTLDEECLSDDDLPRGSNFQFTPAGEAALAVDTAAGAVASEGGNPRGVGLRRRGEGTRWDSAALGTRHRGLPRRYGGGNTGARDSHIWTPLTNPAEMEYYRFAVASDPGKFDTVARPLFSRTLFEVDYHVGQLHFVGPVSSVHRLDLTARVVAVSNAARPIQCHTLPNYLFQEDDHNVCHFPALRRPSLLRLHVGLTLQHVPPQL